MDTGGCAAAAAAHRVVVDPAAATPPVGAKKRPNMTDGWTGTKKNKEVHGSEGGGRSGGGEASSTAVARSRKRSYEYGEFELDDSSDWEKMFKCNYWEDPAYAKKLQYFGLQLARSAAIDNACDRLHRAFEAWMAGDADTPGSEY